MKKIAYFLSGCIITTIIMNSFTVFAETADKIDVVFGRIVLMVNGEKINKETLLYNGTTYVPLRASAEILGKEVAWDSTSNTAYIDEKGTNRQIQIDNKTKTADAVSISPELTALNLVKDYIAGDDDSVFEPRDSSSGLTYKFRNSAYMIQYELKLDNQHYLIRQYEFVIDDPETGEGHTATANWYEVDIHTGVIIPMFDKDGSLNENY